MMLNRQIAEQDAPVPRRGTVVYRYCDRNMAVLQTFGGGEAHRLMVGAYGSRSSRISSDNC